MEGNIHTIEALAALIQETMASKEDIKEVKEDIQELRDERYIKFHRWYDCEKYQVVTNPSTSPFLHTLRRHCSPQVCCNCLI
jgi:hypothetical protein